MKIQVILGLCYLSVTFVFVCSFSQMKKVLKGKHFADVEEVKQKMAEARKGIKISEFKTVLSSGKMSR